MLHVSTHLHHLQGVVFFAEVKKSLKLFRLQLNKSSSLKCHVIVFV